MPIPRIVDLAFLIFASVLLRLTVPSAVRAFRVFLGTGSRRQVDATGEAPEPDDEVLGRIRVLEAALGYRRLGATWTEIERVAWPAWVLTAADARSYVLLAEGPPTPGLTAFYSAWPDGTWLGTHCPRGSPRRFSSLTLRVDPGAVESAALHHRAEAERLAEVHGPPRAVRTMADMLACDADYRTRFGGREFLQDIVVRLIPVGVGLFLVVASLLSLLRP